ncbi:MAG TPA: hypothetical protein RMH99_17905, partial [Sandaracinaceae bacterium LLY-WYZ-13_1]|nr:hypothetical protein [Sandaracinaceae bacterium LLY-WYZ-13_1]
MRAALVALALSTACGPPERPPRTGPDEAMVEEAAGVRLVTVARPTDGRIRLSLWVDAGARAGGHPTEAALAAWAATHGHPAVEARALTDGVELTRRCRRETLDDGLADLAAVLSTRGPSEAALAAARERLRAHRRRVVGDAARTADALALSALLGRPADPLTSPSDEVADEAVAAFLEAHFGAGRALLVAVGDVDRAELRSRVERAFADVPSAGSPRAPAPIEPRREVAVEVGGADALSVATLRESPTDAARIARRLLARLGPDVDASADVFPLAGGAAVIARVRSPDDATRDALLARLVELLEEPARDGALRPADEPAALARWIGARWVGRGEARPGGLGVGAVVDGGRGDAGLADAPPEGGADGDPPPEAGADARLAAQARQRLRGRLEAALAPPALEGEASPDTVDARAAGARIRARRVPGASSVAVAVAFAGGAAEEPPAIHGATALLASVAARACDRIAVEELGARLDALEVRIEPLLTADAWGLRLVGPTARWTELTYLAPRCAAVPRLPAALVERTRAELAARARLRAPLAAAARLLSPANPGRVVPGGSARGLAGLGPGEVRRWRDGRIS